MSRWIYRAILPGALLLLIILGIAVHRFYHGPLPEGEARHVSVDAGAPFRSVCALLESEGILEDAGWFYWIGRIGGAHRRIQAGSYRIVPGAPAGAVLRLLQRGPNDVVRVTIPEGLWLTETADVLSAALGIPKEEIVETAEDPAVVSRLGVPGPTLEGYLFPETYLFFADATARTVLERMVESFHEVFGAGERRRAAELGLSEREAIVLASIIEAEATLDEERPRISAVYHNRLEIGWKLQADPTVQYALGSRRKLLLQDLEYPSPYNTYRIAGLPPGPICSPGAASIRAALSPTEGSKDLFFVASGEGGRHIFSRSQVAHNRAKLEAKQRRDSP